MLLTFRRTVNACRDLEVVAAERAGEDVFAFDVLPEDGGLGNGTKRLDARLGDDGTVCGLPVVLDLMVGKRKGADELRSGMLDVLQLHHGWFMVLTDLIPSAPMRRST